MNPAKRLFVLDASVTLSWAFADEHNPTAAAARRWLEPDAGGALVPAIWWYEIRNILIIGERRGRITPAGTAFFLDQIAELDIELAPQPDEQLLFDISRQEKVTVYDASYLAVAIRENIAIATLDAAMKSAARSRDVPLLA